MVSPSPAARRSVSSSSLGSASTARFEVAGALERADEARVHVFHVGRLHARVGERARLAVVVAQHEVRDLLAHGLEQIVAVRQRELPGPHDPVEEDLQVDLVVRHVDAGAVVDRVGVDEPARERVLDAPALGEPEVAALADDPAAEVGAVDADARRSPCRRRRRCDSVRAFTNVPIPPFQSRSTGARSRREISSFGVRCATSSGMPKRARTSGVIAIAFAVRGYTPPPGEISAAVVVVPRRTGSSNSRVRSANDDGRIGIRVEEHVPVVERGDQPDVPRQQHAVAEHVAGHVADADDREVRVLHVDAELRGSGASPTPTRPGR